MDLASCGLCRPRSGSVDLHRTGASSSGASWASEVVMSVQSDGDWYGLVPSGGTAYVFGTGSKLHHRLECVEGSDTPADRVVAVDDPDGDVWRAVLERRPGGADVRMVTNITHRPVTGACSLCALRPETR
jgi:hypothetical protein